MKERPTESPKPRRKKLWVIFKIAILGALLFGGIDLITTVGAASGFLQSREGPDLSAFVVGALPYLLIKAIDLDHAPLDSFVFTLPFELIVNSLAGAIVFGLIAVCWQFFLQGNGNK